MMWGDESRFYFFQGPENSPSPFPETKEGTDRETVQAVGMVEVPLGDWEMLDRENTNRMLRQEERDHGLRGEKSPWAMVGEEEKPQEAIETLVACPRYTTHIQFGGGGLCGMCVILL